MFPYDKLCPPATALKLTTCVASAIWEPYFPMLKKGTGIVYHFYRESDHRSLYVGKTMLGRDRLRWHYRNTFLPSEVATLYLDILEAPSEETSLQWEIALLQYLLPAYNSKGKGRRLARLNKSAPTVS